MYARIKTLNYLLVFILCFHVSAAWPATRYIITVEAEFSQQGAVGPFEIYNWGQEIIAPIDAASGLPTGKRQHKPFVITKELDAASPLLYQALVTNETISSLTVRVFKQSKSPRNLAFVIKLANARVIGVSKTADADKKTDGFELEKLQFVYQSIEWTDVKSGAVSTDTIGGDV